MRCTSAGGTSKVKPFHGLIFLGSHLTDPDSKDDSSSLGQAGQQERTRSRAPPAPGAELCTIQAPHKRLFGCTEAPKISTAGLALRSHVRALYSSSQTQRHIQARTSISAQQARGRHTRTLLLARHSFSHRRLCSVHLPRLAQVQYLIKQQRNPGLQAFSVDPALQQHLTDGKETMPKQMK